MIYACLFLVAAIGHGLAAESVAQAPSGPEWRELKADGDWSFSEGINQAILHVYIHQAFEKNGPGICFPWGTEFNRKNTWWNLGMKPWVDYQRKCTVMLQSGNPVADVAYFIGEDTPKMTGIREPALPKGYDYDYINAEVILKRLSVKEGRLVLPEGTSYRVLVLPPVETMRPEVLRKIKQLVDAGATVVGPAPKRSPSLENYPQCDQEVEALVKELWGSGKIRPVTDLQTVLTCGPDVIVPPGVVWKHRTDSDREIYFIANQENKACDEKISFRVTGKIPELWHPDTGKRETVALYTTKDGVTTLPIQFDPIGSVFVIFRKEQGSAPHPVAVTPEASLQTDAQNQTVLNAQQNGNYAITWSNGSTNTVSVSGLPEPLTLEGSWNLEFPPFAAGKGEAVKTTFDKLISWSDSTNDAIKYFSSTATYTKNFTLPAGYLAKKRHLTLDLGTVKNLAEVTLNGKELGVLWKEPFQVDVSEAIKEGENNLTIKVTNLWPNRLIGDQKLNEKDRLTWASVSLYKATDPLLPSGLLGPVVLKPAVTLSVNPIK